MSCVSFMEKRYYLWLISGEKTAEIKERKEISNGVVTFHEKLEI